MAYRHAKDVALIDSRDFPLNFSSSVFFFFPRFVCPYLLIPHEPSERAEKNHVPDRRIGSIFFISNAKTCRGM